MDQIDFRAGRLAVVVALAGAISASALAAPPQKTVVPGALVVIDANDKVVGRLSTVGNTAVVYLSINGVLTSFYLGTLPKDGYDDFEQAQPLSSGNQLYFTSANCSGTAYMQYGSGTRAITRQAVVLKTGEQNYLYVAQAVPPTVVSIGSVFQAAGCAQSSGTVQGVPLNSPVNLSTMFAEPYTVR